MASVRSAGRVVCRASAMVCGEGDGDGVSGGERLLHVVPASGSTPQRRISGRSPLAATAQPERRPPPPHGVTIRSRSGTSSRSSRASVPWPAITASSSNGGTRVAPCSSHDPAGDLLPALAAQPVVEDDLGAVAAGGGDLEGGGVLRHHDGGRECPSSRAASATAWAWFPEEKATTPRERSSGVSSVSRENAPRALKAPTRWKISHLKKTGPLRRSSSVREVKTGVRWT